MASKEIASHNLRDERVQKVDVFLEQCLQRTGSELVKDFGICFGSGQKK